jgi:dATP pyrophosphohydrolase
VQTALREVREKTAIEGDCNGCKLTDWRVESMYPLDPALEGTFYAGRVTHNTEHVFGLLVPDHIPVRLNPREHTQLLWLSWQIATGRCSPATHAQAC